MDWCLEIKTKNSNKTIQNKKPRNNTSWLFSKDQDNFNGLEILFFLDTKESPISYAIAQNLLRSYYEAPGSFFDVIYNYVCNYPVSKFEFKDSPKENNQLIWVISEQDKWCRSYRFGGTPVVIFNGHVLNSMYLMKDLDYICF